MPPPNRKPSQGLFGAVLLICVLAVIEAMATGTSAFLAERGVLYEPAGLADYRGYLARRDPLLGWPARSDPDYDPTGARLSPDAGTANCGEVYGDSFSFGVGVSGEATFANLLSERLGCRVANFGVAGYGSDQALMRYRNREARDANFAVLVHLSENVLRNVNQYRALLYAGATDGFKPRFVIDAGGDLVRVPIPEIAPERYADFVAAPERFLEHEYFAPGGASGTSTRRFPHSLALMRAFGHFHVRSEVVGKIWYADFYRSDHPANGLQVTTGIVRAFVHEARANGQVPVPVVLATEVDFAARAETGLGEWSHQPLLDALDLEGVAVLDASDAFLERMQGRPPSEFFADAHPTETGHVVLADILEAHLDALGLRPTTPGEPDERSATD